MRKVYFNLFSIIIFLLGVSSCKKELTSKVSGTSALTLVNGVVGNTFFYTNFNGDNANKLYYSDASTLRYGNFAFFNSYSGQQKLGLYQLPDTNANSKPVFNLTLDLPLNKVHTLFLTGTPQNPDQFFTADELPYHAPADSVIGIRFVNISKGDPPVSVNILGKENGSEMAELPYKGITGFKNYSAKAGISSYMFEFRDKATGMVLGSCLVNGLDNDGSPYMPNIRRNKNFSIAFLGAAGGMASNRALLISENVKY